MKALKILGIVFGILLLLDRRWAGLPDRYSPAKARARSIRSLPSLAMPGLSRERCSRSSRPAR